MMPSSEKKAASNLRTKVLISTVIGILAIVAAITMRGYFSTSPLRSSSVQKPTGAAKSSSVNGSVDTGKHQLMQEDRQFLIEQGLPDPLPDLVRDLMKHNELIPCEGTLGGAPGFYNPDRIAVLSRDQVIAEYDDGHVEGTVELAFTVSRGTISWAVVHSECGN